MKKLLAIFLILLMTIGLMSACKKKTETAEPIEEGTVETVEAVQPAPEPQAEEPEEQDVLAGTTWKLTSSDVGEGEVSVDSDETYTFNNDKTLTLKTSGETYEGTYDISGNSGDLAVQVDDNRAELDFEADGNKLIMTIKHNDATWKYYYTKQ